MSPEHDGWGFNSFTKLLRFFKRDEVKTPLSFLFKIVPYFVIALGVILYAPISEDRKVLLVQWVMYLFLGLSAAVLTFGWFRPKNLVYGETGHRAEYKMELGTEKKTLSPGQLEELTPVENKNRPPLIE